VEQNFSVGDRVQFTAPDKQLQIANRELGTIERLNERGDISIRLDSGRIVQFSIEDNRHLDHGYAVTSHSSQALTADRALLHIDTEHSHPDLINPRLAYVAVSRARFDVQIFTDNAERLTVGLGREVSKSSAIELTNEPSGPTQSIAPAQGFSQEASSGATPGIRQNPELGLDL
jgi:ATP-dependent exoDNAse (exonuclease V) alpha subunit